MALRTRKVAGASVEKRAPDWRTLYCFLGQDTYPGVQMGTDELNVGGNPVMY